MQKLKDDATTVEIISTINMLIMVVIDLSDRMDELDGEGDHEIKEEE
jgi:hypothetical protein